MRAGALKAVAMGLSVAMCLSLATHALAQDAPPAMDARVKAALQACFQCHGENGVSRLPSRPTIAGQKPDYIARQLFAFKRAAMQSRIDDDGDADDVGAAGNLPVRADPVMQHMALQLDDDLILPLAQAVGALKCDGERKAGRKAVAMPAIGARCAVCHGADGIGVELNVPNLAGQQRAYLRRQLLLIRETAWGAKAREGEEWRTHPIMERQSARLKIEDVDALASYYAGLDCRGALVATPDGIATE